MSSVDTHTVTIEIEFRCAHRSSRISRISIDGEGDLDHMIEAFKAALVTAGFSLEVAKKLDEIDE